MGHKHNVHDKDARFIIDPSSKTIKNASNKKTTLIQFDHNSERLTFEIPKEIEGHDMSQCNKVEVHYFNIDAQTKETKSGVYKVEDLKIDPDNPNAVVCSWLISKNSTRLCGLLKFLLRYKCVDENNVETYAWNTNFFTGISVSEGSDADASFETEYVDIIEQWKASVLQGFEDEFTAWKEQIETQVNVDISKWKQEASEAVEDDFNAHSAEWNQKLAVERARIDQFTKLEEGSTTGDAELQDIRVGADGKAYESAGAAVRGQVQKINNGIELGGMGCEKLKGTFVQGGLNLDGSITTQTYYASTSEPVEYDYDIVLRVKEGYSYKLYTQNEDGTYADSSVKTTDTIIPKGTRFLIRLQTEPVTYSASDISVFSEQIYCENHIGNIANVAIKNSNTIVHMKSGNELVEGYYNRGSLSKGTWGLWVSYRVCTPNTITYDRDITIKVKEGFDFAVHTFDNDGNFLNDSSWVWKKDIEAGVPFKVVIKRENEDTNEIADVTEFANAIYISTEFKEEIQNILFNPFKKNYICHGKTPLVGHMGLRKKDESAIPENSIVSFEYAGECGIWAMEADIHETADGHFVCIHDPTLDRTTNGTGEIANMTLEEIQKYYLKDTSGKVTGYKVPRFEEYLSICKMYGVVPLIEIKAISTYSAFFNIIRNYGFMDNAMLTGGLWRLDTIRQYTDDMLYIVLPTQTDYAEVYDTLKFHHSVGVSLLYTNETLTEEIVHKMHENNIFVQLWSINDTDVIKSWFRKGVDAVVTDVLTTLD